MRIFYFYVLTKVCVCVCARAVCCKVKEEKAQKKEQVNSGVVNV